MPTPREDIGDRMLYAVDNFVEERKTSQEQKTTEFLDALSQFMSEYLDGRTYHHIHSNNGTVTITFIPNK